MFKQKYKAASEMLETIIEIKKKIANSVQNPLP